MREIGHPEHVGRTAPASSSAVHVATTGYNTRGEAFQAIDPAGTQTRHEFDDAGRRVTLINNYVDGNPSNGTPDEDQTMLWTYTPDGQVATLTAKNPATGDQVTTYVYGTTTANSLVARSDLLRSVEYPGNASDVVFYKYNRLGQVTEFTDQNETVHEYSYDVRGRQTADRITEVGSGVDDAVRRIETSYTPRHAIEKITSYDAAAGGNVVNQVQFSYNGFNQLFREFQEHTGAVNTMTSPRVEYGYANGTANTTRRVAMVYPDGRVLSYDYGSAGGQGDKLSRVESLVDDDTTHLADYTYLGLASVVRVDSPEPDVRYNLATGSGASTYAGLDRFDRTATCLWQGDVSGTPADVVKLGYTYDRVSNRLTREDHVAKAQMTPQYFDEKYSYDGLYRLVDFERGQLSGGSITSRNFRQNWQGLTSPFDTALDPTGNWTAFNQNDDGQGAWELEQSRQHNQANEITDIDQSAGTAWPTPSYDDAGNTTSFPQPAALADSYAATYDAWQRLVKLADGADTVATFAYDGSNRRVTKGEYAGGDLDDAGRRLSLINHYVDGNPANGTPDEDQTMLWTYTPDGQVATLTAKNPATGDQVTTYVYGTTTANSLVARSDLLRSVEYPGNASDKVFYEYNRLGQVTEFTDQNETVHEYSYDVRGRQTADRITEVGSGVDGAVRRIETSYTPRHAIDKITSYDAAAGGNVVNQVQFSYNGFNQLFREFQEHAGAGCHLAVGVDCRAFTSGSRFRPAAWGPPRRPRR